MLRMIRWQWKWSSMIELVQRIGYQVYIIVFQIIIGICWKFGDMTRWGMIWIRRSVGINGGGIHWTSSSDSGLLVRPGMLPFGVRIRFVFVRLIFSLKMLTRCRIRGWVRLTSNGWRMNVVFWLPIIIGKWLKLMEVFLFSMDWQMWMIRIWCVDKCLSMKW